MYNQSLNSSCFFQGNCVVCKVGHGYPYECPRLEDPPTYTRCCRHYYEARCCEERSGHVCYTRGSGWNVGKEVTVKSDVMFTLINCLIKSTVLLRPI